MSQNDLLILIKLEKRLAVCLLVGLLFFILIILGNQQKVTLKISWRSDLIWLRYESFCILPQVVCMFSWAVRARMHMHNHKYY